MYYYEKISIVDDQILCYRFSKDKGKLTPDGTVVLIDHFEDTTMNQDNPFSNEKIQKLSLLVKKTYVSLQKKHTEHKTLDVSTMTCNQHLDIDINFCRAILLEDESIVVFNDFSESQKGFLKSIIKKGALI